MPNGDHGRPVSSARRWVRAYSSRATVDPAGLVLQDPEVEHAAQLAGQVAGRPGLHDRLLEHRLRRSRLAGALTQPGQGGPGVGCGAGEPEPVGQLERLRGDLGGLLVPPLLGHRAGVQPEHLGAHRLVRVLLEQLQRLGRDLQGVGFGVGDDGDRGLDVQQPQPGPWRGVRGGGAQLVARQRQRPVGLAGGQRRLAGPGGEVDHVEVLELVQPGVGHQLERELVVPGRLVRAGDDHRLVARGDAGPGGGRDVVGCACVLGQLRRRTADPALLQRLGVGRVQPHPLTGQQVVVDRLGEQRVPERVALAAHGEQDVALDRGAQGDVQRTDLAVEDPLEQQVGDPAAGHGGGPDHQPGVVVELVEPDQQEVGKGLRQRARPQRGRLHQLLGEEGVALRPLDDAAHRPLGERVRVQRPDEGPDVVVGEPGQVEPGHARQPGPLGDGRTQGMAAVQVVAAVGRHDRDGGVEAAGEQEAEHLAGRPVGPVHVLDDEQQRSGAAQLLEGRVDRGEQVGPVEVLGVGVVDGAGLLGQEPARRQQPGDDGARIDQRRARAPGRRRPGVRTPR